MITDWLVDHRRILVGAVLLVSVLMIPLVLRMEMDRTLKSAYVTSSPAYFIYQDFLEVFGNDEFVLVAIKNKKRADDPAVLKALEAMTTKLDGLPEILRVLSLTNFKVAQNRNGLLGFYPLMRKKGDQMNLPPREDLVGIRKALPLTDFLLSKDMKTVGIMVLIKDRWKFDPKMGDIQQSIANVVSDNLPEGSEFRLIGAPVIREHVQGITLRTAVIFGIVCTIIIALVSLYIFKSLRVAAIATAVVGLAVHWIIALMSLVGIPLNSTTSLSFGLVLVVSLAAVVHIVTHYYKASETIEDQVEAVKESLRVVGRPALMCSITTSIAFATIMVSSIPMVRQLGLIMSLGVLLAFVLSVILTPACLIALKPVDQRTRARMSKDVVTWVFERMESFVFRHYRFCAWAGIVFAAFMIAGSPLIRIDTQILRLFVDSSPVLADIRFAEDNLTSVHALELVVEKKPGAFKKPGAWKEIPELQRRLKAIPEVVGVDSPLPFFEYIHGLLLGSKDKELLSDKRFLTQVRQVIGLNSEGKKLRNKYMDRECGKIHLTVRINNDGSQPMGDIISKVERAANRAVKGSGKVTVTGELVVFSAQASEVVDSQVYSLILAFTAITLMMMIQFRSWILGLLSLIPNLLPIAVIFGVMGWLGVSLDNVTVFAATIAIGLSVDDTIHYLTQLKRDMSAPHEGEPNIERSLRQAYQTSAKALISTTLTLFFGFMALSLTPTQPAIYFGFLGSSAIMAALLGDLVVMPAVILTFKPIKRLVNREIAARNAGPPSPQEAGA